MVGARSWCSLFQRDTNAQDLPARPPAPRSRSGCGVQGLNPVDAPTMLLPIAGSVRLLCLAGTKAEGARVWGRQRGAAKSCIARIGLQARCIGYPASARSCSAALKGQAYRVESCSVGAGAVQVPTSGLERRVCTEKLQTAA